MNSDSVQSSIARQLDFAAEKRRPGPAAAGAAELIVDLYRRLRTHADRGRRAGCAVRLFRGAAVRPGAGGDGAAHNLVQRERTSGKRADAAGDTDGDRAFLVRDDPSLRRWQHSVRPLPSGYCEQKRRRQRGRLRPSSTQFPSDDGSRRRGDHPSSTYMIKKMAIENPLAQQSTPRSHCPMDD